MVENKHGDGAANDKRDDSPRFGRLLLVLISAVALIVVITFATEAYYTP